ncbi:MAG: hypothetical protein HXS41_14485 [Theionarchaea archaeon]|nr:hypothetical protein [Theionarchaea archaeon]MBU7001793.1 hypothetical protein [Theionarchaea archaeon]MBU7022258.1 hypothetical protein [Theionarchaea archaeon]
MECVMVMLLNVAGIRSWLRLEDSEWFWGVLAIFCGIAIVVWLYFRIFARGVRNSAKKAIFVLSAVSLALVVAGTLGYLSFDKFGIPLDFLGGYEEILFSSLLVTALIFLILILLLYWREIQWRRNIQARSAQLKKETEDMQKNVRGVETREGEIKEFFAKTEQEIDNFKGVHDEFQKG